MFDYKNYRPEQFATDASFRRWKLQADEEEGRFWEEWVAQHPEKQKDIEKAALLLEAVGEAYDGIGDTEIRREIDRLARKLDQQEETVPETATAPTLHWWQRPGYQAAAATLVGLLGLGWWLLRSYQSVPAPLSYQELIQDQEIPLTEFVNTDATARLLTLADGSTIRLQPGSKVSYPTGFSGDTREVYLSGEGFFEVVKDPQRPFLVYANQVVTKVLGTSFTIQADPRDERVQVVVRTGRVSVYPNSRTTGHTSGEATDEIVLTPNQKVVYLARGQQFAKSLVEAPHLVMEPEAAPPFAFKGAPIDEVFEKLEKAYGIEIIFDGQVMKDCYLTASFTDEPLFEKLDLITRTISATYRQEDGRIVISSSGCK